MTAMRNSIAVFLLLSCATIVRALETPVKTEWLFPDQVIHGAPEALLKERVWDRMEEVEAVARLTKGLDALGRATMPQSVALLELGPDAIAPLSLWLEKGAQDWRMRYWVVDLLGFLKDPDSLKPLVRVVKNSKEAKVVRLRALRSLEELGYPQGAEGLKKIAPAVREGDLRSRIQVVVQRLEAAKF